LRGIKITISSIIRSKFQEIVINWANKNLIKYPWRENRTPYKVLISEILLTRTKAKQVEPVYIKFIEKYPTLKAFLSKDLDNIEELIQSLGLKFRGDFIKEIVKQLKVEFNQKIPNTIAELKKLKGIGDYGANAVLCFGFNKKSPLIDTNFIRIYDRVFGVKPKTKTAKSDKYLWQFSENLLPEDNFVNFNYGVLDLGGNTCLSR